MARHAFLINALPEIRIRNTTNCRDWFTYIQNINLTERVCHGCDCRKIVIIISNLDNHECPIYFERICQTKFSHPQSHFERVRRKLHNPKVPTSKHLVAKSHRKPIAPRCRHIQHFPNRCQYNLASSQQATYKTRSLDTQYIWLFIILKWVYR